MGEVQRELYYQEVKNGKIIVYTKDWKGDLELFTLGCFRCGGPTDVPFSGGQRPVEVRMIHGKARFYCAVCGSEHRQQGRLGCPCLGVLVLAGVALMVLFVKAVHSLKR